VLTTLRPHVHAAAGKSISSRARRSERLRQQTKIILWIFTPRQTSEKIAFARMLDGQVSAVVGHALARADGGRTDFPRRTAYLTDAGFTARTKACWAAKSSRCSKRFLTGMPQRFEVAIDRVLLHGRSD